MNNDWSSSSPFCCLCLFVSSVLFYLYFSLFLQSISWSHSIFWCLLYFWPFLCCFFSPVLLTKCPASHVLFSLFLLVFLHQYLDWYKMNYVCKPSSQPPFASNYWLDRIPGFIAKIFFWRLQQNWILLRHTWGWEGSLSILKSKSLNGSITFGWLKSHRTKRSLLVSFQVSFLS